MRICIHPLGPGGESGIVFQFASSANARIICIVVPVSISPPHQDLSLRVSFNQSKDPISHRRRSSIWIKRRVEKNVLYFTCALISKAFIVVFILSGKFTVSLLCVHGLMARGLLRNRHRRQQLLPPMGDKVRFYGNSVCYICIIKYIFLEMKILYATSLFRK